MNRIRITFRPDESLLEVTDGRPDITEETWLEIHEAVSRFGIDFEIEVIA